MISSFSWPPLHIGRVGVLFGAGEAVAVALKGLLHKVTLCVEHGQQHITVQHAVVVNLGAPAHGGGRVIVGGLDVKGRRHTRLDEVLNHLVKDFRALIDRHGESQGNGLGLVANHGIAQAVDFLGVDGGLALKLLGHQHGSDSTLAEITTTPAFSF